MDEGQDDTLITLTADIVAAHVSNNSVAVNDLPQLIQNVHGALSGPVHPWPRHVVSCILFGSRLSGDCGDKPSSAGAA